jgi:hypothetical protein
MSMLMPVQTLARPPLVTDPSPLQVLALLVGFPAVAFVVIALLGKASSLARQGRGESAEINEPAWLGAAPESRELTAGGTVTAASSGGSSALEVGAGHSGTGNIETGGASARW